MLSLEHRLLEQNIKHNLITEKSSKILEIIKAFCHVWNLRPNISLDDFEQSNYGLTKETKYFEKQITADLDIMHRGHELIREKLKNKSNMDSWIEKMGKITTQKYKRDVNKESLVTNKLADNLNKKQDVNSQTKQNLHHPMCTKRNIEHMKIILEKLTADNEINYDKMHINLVTLVQNHAKHLQIFIDQIKSSLEQLQITIEYLKKFDKSNSDS